MKSKIKYTNEPMGKVRIIKNFLPPPEMLILKDDNVKVTISLSRGSVDFFKREGYLRLSFSGKPLNRARFDVLKAGIASSRFRGTRNDDWL
jgi:hypothetical protein